jgi:hypothetical protein
VERSKRGVRSTRMTGVVPRRGQITQVEIALRDFAARAEEFKKAGKKSTLLHALVEQGTK